jgi:hypothetical protein
MGQIDMLVDANKSAPIRLKMCAALSPHTPRAFGALLAHRPRRIAPIFFKRDSAQFGAIWRKNILGK